MSQHPLGNSGALYHNPAGLKPVLRSALASLEVQLDQELARYRRARTGQRTQISQPRMLSLTNLTNGDKTLPSENLEIALRSSLVKANAVTPNLATSVPERSKDSPTTPSNTKLQQGEQVAIATSIQKLPNTSIVPTEPKRPDARRLANAALSGSAVAYGGKPAVGAASPDDYLESSEALLRSLTEEQKTHTQTHHHDSLLSPLGIGSMLLLLLASLSVGYVAFNPKSLPHFNVEEFFQPNENLNAENTSKTQPDQPLTPIPKYPDLAHSEFPEVKDSNDVVGLKPKAKLVPIAPPKPIADARPANLLPSAQPMPPLPPSTSSTFAKTEAPLKPNTEIQLSLDGYYHLVTDNHGNLSLATARQVVPDAYVSSDGKLIYLGAVKNKDKAKQLLHDIQAKGIKARIAQP